MTNSLLPRWMVNHLELVALIGRMMDPDCLALFYAATCNRQYGLLIYNRTSVIKTIRCNTLIKYLFSIYPCSIRRLPLVNAWCSNRRKFNFVEWCPLWMDGKQDMYNLWMWKSFWFWSLTSKSVKKTHMWKMEVDVAVCDMASKYDVTKVMLSHPLRWTKSKNKIVDGPNSINEIEPKNIYVF
jgi:hypothetical protein